jgi:hypothetical protein
MKMKAAKTLIAWNSVGLTIGKAPPGSIGIGPLIYRDDRDWVADLYDCTGGAAYTDRRKLKGAAQQHHVMLEWYTLVYSYGLHPYTVHRAFLLIDEYQAIIKAAGFGPARDEPGHDPNVCYGRTVHYPIPVLQIVYHGGTTHFWPTGRMQLDREQEEAA